MTPGRNTGSDHRPSGPLTARQIVASTLLGVDPPRLPSRQLVRAGELFGITEGTTRVALSRMVRAGELEADDGWYRLAGPLLNRRARQAEGRHPSLRAWSGEWCAEVVRAERRAATARTDLRAAMRSLRYEEQREGVWLRPDNLDPERLPEARAVRDEQCERFTARPRDLEAGALARQLWDLDGWAADARRFLTAMDTSHARLERNDVDALAPGWELSAAVLRHLLADPLLPAELQPKRWPGDELRTAYDTYDSGFKRLWRRAFADA
jgi:phenylacetic acid degradation operon negative regulatory protein